MPQCIEQRDYKISRGKRLHKPAPTDLLSEDDRELFKEILDEQKLKTDREGQRRTAYSLRHTYICMRLMEGADIYQIAKNCRTSVEMIEKYYASHIKTSLDAAAINVRKPKVSTAKAEAKANRRMRSESLIICISFHLAGAPSLDIQVPVRGRGEIGRRNGLKQLSAQRETGGVELLKVGETLNGNPEPSPVREGVETRRAAPKAGTHGEGIVQTTNAVAWRAAAKAEVV